jgi:hypothetical protein
LTKALLTLFGISSTYISLIWIQNILPMKKTVLFLTVLIVLAISCKKKEENPIEPVASSPSDPNMFNGFLISSTWTNSIGGSNKTTGQGAEARFHATPVKNFGGPNDINLNYLSVNNATLTNDNMFVYMLMSPNDTLNLAVDTWSVNGSSVIPSFSFTNTNPYPSCANFNIIPDSMSKTKGFKFTIDNVTNITSGWLSIGDGVAAMLNYSIVPGTNIVEVKPSELRTMAIGTSGFITLDLEATVKHSFSGKNFKFIKKAYLTKSFKITP